MLHFHGLGNLSVGVSVVFDELGWRDPEEHLDSFVYMVAVFVRKLHLWSDWV